MSIVGNKINYLVFVFFFLAAISLAETHYVSNPKQLTDSDKYERGQAIVFDGSDYWLFYTRSLSVSGYYQNDNPDINDYAIYYKKAQTLAGLETASAIAIDGAGGVFRGELSANVFDNKVWVFAAIDPDPDSDGDKCAMIGWHTSDGGNNWTAGEDLIDGSVSFSDVSAYHNTVVHAGRIWRVTGDSQFYTRFAAASPELESSWSSPLSVDTRSGGGRAGFLSDDSNLWLVVTSNDSSFMYLYNNSTFVWNRIDSSYTPRHDYPLFFETDQGYILANTEVSSGNQSRRLVYRHAQLPTDILASDVLAFSSSVYGLNSWSEMRPVGFADSSGGYYGFFTSERNDRLQEGTGHIWYMELDWPHGFNHQTFIQTGIDSSGVHDTLQISEGVYTENVVVHHQASLIANNFLKDPVEINPGSGIGVEIVSNNVTLQGLTIHGAETGISAFYYSDHVGTLYPRQSIRILENTIYDIANDSLGYGILIGTESERYNPDDPLGIYDPDLIELTDFTGLRIMENEIYNTSGPGLALRAVSHGVLGPLFVYENSISSSEVAAIWLDAVDDVILDGNDLGDSEIGVLLTNFADGYYEMIESQNFDTRNVAAVNNKIENNTTAGVALYDGYPELIDFYENTIAGNGINFINALTTEIIAERNHWGNMLCDSIALGLSGSVDYEPWCDVWVSVCEFDCTLEEIWVDDDYCFDCHNDLRYWGYNAFASLTEAIEAVSPGGLIHVLPGNYEGQLVLNKDISISGSPGAIVEPPPEGLVPYSLAESSEVFYPMLIAYGGTDDGNGYISGDSTIDATVTRLTFNGNNSASTDNFVGVLCRNCDGSSEISTNTFQELLGSSGDPEISGILVFGRSDLEINANRINDWNRFGIAIIGDDGPMNDPHAAIINNTINGSGPSSELPPQNGILVCHGASGQVLSNNISDISCSLPTDTAYAILANYPASGVAIEGNSVADCQGGTGLNFCINANISNNNIFSGNEFVLISNGIGINVDGNQFSSNDTALTILNTANVTINDNYFTLNDVGLMCVGSSTNIDITKNTFLNNFDAAARFKEYLSIEPTGIQVNGNSFSDNGIAVDNRTLVMTNAVGNWWNHINGPKLPGDTVSANVDYSPWWGNNYVNHSHMTPWTWQLDNSHNSTIQEAVDAASDNDSVNVLPGTYNAGLNIENRQGIVIRGAGVGLTRFEPSSRLDWNVGPYGSTRQTGIRIVNSSDIKLSSMAIDFSLIKADNTSGLFLYNSSGKISQNTLANMGVADILGAYNEMILFAEAAGPGFDDDNRASIDIIDNEFTNSGRNAIRGEGWVALSIDSNTISKSEDDYGFGIELGSASAGSITNNDIRGFDTWAISDQKASAGIYIHSAYSSGYSPHVRNVSVEYNDVHECQNGIMIGNTVPGISGEVGLMVQLDNNNIFDCAASQPEASAGIIVTNEGADGGCYVDVALSNNNIAGNGDFGLQITGIGNSDIRGLIIGNQVIAHDVGIWLSDIGGTSSFSISVYHNLFNNTVNAAEYISGTIWDDGVSEGNCWSDYDGEPGGQYNIIGTGGGVDNFANVFCSGLCDCSPGEADGDISGPPNLLDILYIIAGVYNDGPEPEPYALCSGDVDCDCMVNLIDILDLIDSIYSGGDEPCSCSEWIANCGLPIR